MIVLLGILIMAWLLSSNIKWMLILAACFMMLVNGCRLRRDEAGYEPPQAEHHHGELSRTGLPIVKEQICAVPPGQLQHDTGW